MDAIIIERLVIKTCVQFDSLDLHDRQRNCGLCQHYIGLKCEIVERLKLKYSEYKTRKDKMIAKILR
jgi:hypothetical protein